MSKIHINITGPDRSGKTTVATKIEEMLFSIGYDVTRTEDCKQIPLHRRRLYARHDWVTTEPRAVVVNEELFTNPQMGELKQWRELPAKVEALISQANIPLSAAVVRTAALNQVLDLIDKIRHAGQRGQPPTHRHP